ncbi:unnamed protein product, partial [Timema podura]|nr:unnamed protein product [Timema podura]
LHKLSGELEEVLLREPQTNRLYGVKVYSHQVQTIENNHPCSFNNGGCDKLCFAVPSNQTVGLQAKCACPYGERVKETGGTECAPDPSAEPPMQACPNAWDFTCYNQR